MLALAIVGLLCGERSYTAIARWARLHPNLRHALGFTAKQMPAASTFHYLFRRLDITAVEKVLTEWTTKTLASLDISTSDLKGLAIDGKILGNSHTKNARRPHLLAAFLHEVGIPIAELSVREKTNEIPVSIQLLKAFDVTGLVITTDALLTQRKFCQEILERDAHYCLPVKANQRQLYADIRDLFRPLNETDPPEVNQRRFENLHAEAGAHLQTYTDTENARGKITTRTLTASTLLTKHTDGSEHIDWPGLQQVYQYTTHQVCKSTGQEKHYVQYGITSLSPERASAADLLKLRREHSTIENKLHWVRDKVFQEDASTARTAAIPQVMAAMRNAAISVLRFTGH
ncbi:MAG: ISAs1 family transposase, partial [Candidatus Omnitrophica bacterium]|nr:ISAs1 family transposase [Candidatus Omnitrophota bacterium]